MAIQSEILSEVVSVVVPVFNRQDLVIRCLDSIFAQTYRPIDLIIVDNNSTDNTVPAVKEWMKTHNDSDFRISLLEETFPGAAAARQRGLEAVKTDKILFFDSDDIMHDDLVQRAIYEFHGAGDPDVVLWNGRIIYPDKNVKLLKTKPGNFFRQHIVHSIFRTQGYMAKTDFIRKCGGWNNNMRVWDDYELGWRICLNHPVISLINKELVTIFHQEQSITGSNFHEKAGQWEKALDEIENMVNLSKENPCAKKRLTAWIDYRRMILAANYLKEGKRDIAANLMNRTLRNSSLSASDKLLLKLLYHYTSCGGRGAYILWKLKAGHSHPELHELS